MKSQMAIGKALRRDVQYRDAPISLFPKIAKSLGISEFVIEELYWFLIEYQRNAFGLGAPTQAVLEVGGAEPERRRVMWLNPAFPGDPLVRTSPP